MVYKFLFDMRAFKARRLTKFEREIRRKHTRVVSGGRGKCRAHIVAGTQSFCVQIYDGSRRTANWYRDQVAKALATFYEQTYQERSR